MRVAWRRVSQAPRCIGSPAKRRPGEPIQVTTSTIEDGRGEENRRHETMSTRSPIRAGTRRLPGGGEVEGQALVEYSLIFVLIIIVCFAIVG
jgi:hypothetical protein